MEKEKIKAAFLGHAIGDALGVPVEFYNRSDLKLNPVTGFRAFGSWNQPAGTFSDDSSMMFCTAEALCDGLNYNAMAQNFVKWYKHGYWGAHDKLFDIGGTTRKALNAFIIDPDKAELCGEMMESSNGNGSLMRILPLIFYLHKEEDIQRRYTVVKNVSSITHMHLRSVLGCFIFVEYGILLLQGHDKFKAYTLLQAKILDFIKTTNFNETEVALFDRILKGNIAEEDESRIFGSGYVLHTLEASLWCLLTTDTYLAAALKAVNLGADSDTTGAVTGGLAGLYYGLEAIPLDLTIKLAKMVEIERLSERFYEALP